MPNTLKMPTYHELISLSDYELTTRVERALQQLKKAVKQCEGTAEKTKIYRAYQNELAKRKYSQRLY